MNCLNPSKLMATENSWIIRFANIDDRRNLESLLQRAHWKHQHLDWFHAEDLLEQDAFLMALENGRPIACLACPPDPPGVAWIRLCLVSSHTQPEQAWEQLWPFAESVIRKQAVSRTAALQTSEWLGELLRRSRFTHATDVVFLDWQEPQPPPAPSTEGELRVMRSSDLEAVLEIDHQAFEDIWRLSRATLYHAFRSSAYASLLDLKGRAVAYQITTFSPYGGHIARLAVMPRFQGAGIGRAIVTDVLQRISPSGRTRVTVNTQIDNERSLRLYKGLGFRTAGSGHPVYQLAL